jgi:hypothetical protein
MNPGDTDFVLEHEEYAFYLPGPWHRLPGDDPLQLQLACDPLDTRLTLSIEFMATAREALQPWAEKLLATRRASHHDWLARVANQRPGREVVIADEKLTPLPAVDSVEVSYTGRITGVGSFAFVGYVTPRKVVSLFCETRLSFSPSRMGVFRSVARGFKNKLP